MTDFQVQESELAEWRIAVCPECGAQEHDPPSDCAYCESGGQLKTITVVEKRNA